MVRALPLEVIRRPESAVALLDPTRQKLLSHLAEPDSAAGLARQLRLPRQRVNYHLRALERAGLVELVAERRKGNCLERVVRATARAFVISPEALGALGPTAETVGDRLSTAYLIAAAGRTIRDVAALDARARRERKRIATLMLEADVRFASGESRAAFAEELADVVTRLAAKYHDERAPGGRRFRLLAAIHPTPSEERTVKPTPSHPERSEGGMGRLMAPSPLRMTRIASGPIKEKRMEKTAAEQTREFRCRSTSTRPAKTCGGR
jgi:DNA-binding transcriptional ArsR family regulator